MGTTAHVVIVDGPAGLLDNAEARLHDLENLWSRFRQGSELSQLNRRSGNPVVVSVETYRLITKAIDAWRLTAGRFDPTLAGTMELAGYDRSFELLAEPASHRPAIHEPAPTPLGVELDPHCRSILVPPGVRFDLGGIAKGAAADLVVSEVLAAGAGGCCVNVGGDLRVQGRSPRNDGWRVDLGSTSSLRGSPLIAHITCGAVCTSTTTRRRWTTKNGTEHHLRNPTTGGSISNTLETVSVIGATATQAEVLTKAAFVAGIEDGITIILDAGATGLFTMADGAETALPGLDRFINNSAELSEVH